MFDTCARRCWALLSGGGGHLEREREQAQQTGPGAVAGGEGAGCAASADWLAGKPIVQAQLHVGASVRPAGALTW